MVQYMPTTDGPVCLEDVYLLTTDPVWPKGLYLLTTDGPVRANYRRSSLPQSGVRPDYGLSSLLERSVLWTFSAYLVEMYYSSHCVLWTFQPTGYLVEMYYHHTNADLSSVPQRNGSLTMDILVYLPRVNRKKM